MIVRNATQLTYSLPLISAHAEADEDTGYVVFTISNGVDEMQFALDWFDARAMANTIAAIAEQAKEAEQELDEEMQEARRRCEDDEDGEDGQCTQGMAGNCSVCS